MAQRIRMRNKTTGAIKYMPEATSKLATILSRWEVEDAEVQTKKAMPVYEPQEDKKTEGESYAKSQLIHSTDVSAKEVFGETTETAAEKPAPKPTAKRKSKAKAKK